MDRAGDSVDVQCGPLEIFSSKDKQIVGVKNKIIGMIISAICALLNSHGGKVILQTDVKHASFSQMSSLIRIIEQTMDSIIGTHHTVSNIGFEYDQEKFEILVKKVDSLVTTNYNLCLPSETQIIQVAATEPLKNVIDIINRKARWQLIVSGSHQKAFLKNNKCGFPERKTVQFKFLKSDASKRTTLADRITGKGNKFTSYVSGFANHDGGHIYYGINDDGVVEGQFIPSDNDKKEITKKVEKAINKMIWPEQIGQPKQGEHWEIFFEPVVDENLKPIPSIFVIVIFVAPCLGGVFTEEPECYEMVDGEVTKMSFDTWKQKAMSFCDLINEELPTAVQRIKWSSATIQQRFRNANDVLMTAINNGNWKNLSILTECFERTYPRNVEIQLTVLSKRVIACCRQSCFKKAEDELLEYDTAVLTQIRDQMFFEAIGVYLQLALERAKMKENVNMNIILKALTIVDLLAPGVISASLLLLVATCITDNQPCNRQVSREKLCERALEHLEKVRGHSVIKTDLKRKAHIVLAKHHLACSFSATKLCLKDPKEVSFDRAESSISAVTESIPQGGDLASYREIQFENVRSVLNYRYSQVERSEEYLKEAYNLNRVAKRKAEECQFQEMIEWTKANDCFYTVELVRANFRKIRKRGGSSTT